MVFGFGGVVFSSVFGFVVALALAGKILNARWAQPLVALRARTHAFLAERVLTDGARANALGAQMRIASLATDGALVAEGVAALVADVVVMRINGRAALAAFDPIPVPQTHIRATVVVGSEH